MYNFAFAFDVTEIGGMEAEHLNIIVNRLTDLAERHLALRGYL